MNRRSRVNNPNLKRYVGPDDGVLGHNANGNHWNRSDVDKCVHAFIGYDKDNVVRCYNTLPWDQRSWGCGSGPNGSYNDSHIQFEICEDDLVNKNYFDEAFKMAVELCAHLCKEFDISVDNIVSHKEAHDQGFASGHGDPHEWLRKYDWTMEVFRQKVAEEIGGVEAPIGVVVVTYSGSDGLNIRSAPKIADNIVRVAYEGEELNAVEEVGGWYMLDDGNYVSANSNYVSFRQA